MSKKIIQSCTSIDTVFETPSDLDQEKFLPKNTKPGLPDRLIDGVPTFIWNLATGKKKSLPMSFTTTLLNVYIATDDLASAEFALQLGANPLTKTTWMYDAFELSIQFEKDQALNLLFKKYPFESLPKDRQQSLILAMPRQKTHGNFFFGYTCEMDASLLEVGLKNKIDFDYALEKENMMKDRYPSSLMQEALNDPHGALTVE